MLHLQKNIALCDDNKGGNKPNTDALFKIQ